MRVVRAAEHRRMRWKNGAGETIEFAISPPAASLDAFDWRFSRASVSSPGPFSLFPDCDRTLCVISGGPIKLEQIGLASMTLDSNSPPYTFPADTLVEASVLGEPVSDLNLIWRRGGFMPRLKRYPESIEIMSDEHALVLVSGRAVLEDEHGTHDLVTNDLVVLEAETRTTVTSSHGALYKVEIGIKSEGRGG